MTLPAVEVKNLSKTFDPHKPLWAVDDVSFTIRQGEIFSLLGPNGAGKTTTLSILSGLLRPTGGDACVFGHSIRQEPATVKTLLGVVPQDIALYEDLSAAENLVFWGRMYNLEGAALRHRVDEVLEIIGLADRQHDRVGKYSGGMKRRVNIGVALLHRPKLIYMDEPTVGIDPQSRRSILDCVLTLKNQGTTVLYTTHYMEEAEELSDTIAIMDRGKIIASGSRAELVKRVGEVDRIRLTVNTRAESIQEMWRAIPGVRQVSAAEGNLTVLADDSNQILPRLFETSAAAKVRITALDIQEPNLEAVFLQLTGKALRD